VEQVRETRDRREAKAKDREEEVEDEGEAMGMSIKGAAHNFPRLRCGEEEVGGEVEVGRILLP